MSRAEKFGKKSSTASGTSKIELKKKSSLSLRNPLKDLNSINTTSISSSQSIEVPRGCLRFFLSNSSSKTPLYNPKSLPKTPKSAPNPRPSKPRSKTLLKNPEKPTFQNPQKAKKPISSRLNQWQNGKNSSFGAPPPNPKPSPILEENDVNGFSVKKFGSGSFLEVTLQNRKPKKQWPITGMMVGGDTGESPELRLIDFQKKIGHEDGVNKVECGFDLDSTPGKAAMEDNLITTTTTTTTTPPVQASISPEIQCGSSLASTTSACFGAGYVLSGVTDKRKCRPRGILTVGEDLGFCKARVSNGSFSNNDDDDFIGFLNNSRVSLVPAPVEASMHWLLSPCKEDKGSPQNVEPAPSHSPSSGHGVSPCESPEFEGFGGCCKALMSKDEREYRYQLTTEENSPLSEYSLGSQNVILTPQSDSSSDRNVGLSWLNNVEDNLECKFELPTRTLSPKQQSSMWDPSDVLPLPGFSFQFQKTFNNDSSLGISSERFESLSRSQMRISWREGLVSRIFEMDELDCCRWKSDDEEEDINSSVDHHFKSDLDRNMENDPTLTDDFASLEFVSKESGIEEKSNPQKPNSCAESISTEGGGLVTSEDSDWTLCYKNKLFEV